VSRSWTAFRILLGIQTALAGAAAATEWSLDCGACRAGGLSLGLVGFAFYAGLFGTALFAGPGRFVFGSVLFGLGIHVMLAAQLVRAGLACGLCFAAAAASLALAALAVACDRSNLGRLALVLPWAVLFVVGWSGLPRAESASEAEGVRLTVFEQPDCPYCEDLRSRVMPEIEREFGGRVRVAYRDSGELPGVRRTPTVVVAPARRDRPSRVIEGLPTVDALRDAVRAVERKP
jgi:hypothetical protein